VAAANPTQPLLLRIERNAGHGGSDLVKHAVAQSVDTLAFLFAELGVPSPTTH